MCSRRHVEMPAEEVCCEAVGCDPAFVHEEAVDLVGEDVLFELDSLCAQGCGHLHGLAEGNVAVVVTLDEQHRRLPGFDGSHGRGLEGEFGDGGVGGDGCGC